MAFLANKNILITGLASQRSIAYGIAEAMHAQGARLAFTYQNERLQLRVEEMAAHFGSTLVFPCDVSKDEDMTAVFDWLCQQWDGLDGLVHSVAYAPADQIGGDFMTHVNRKGFEIAHDISVYSLVGLSKAAQHMMSKRQGAILTLSYYGAEKAMPNYNVMGVAKASLEATVRYMAASLGPQGHRVNAISAGPIKTLAAAGIKDFRKIQAAYDAHAPLKRNVTAREVGDVAAFLCSHLASGITGEVVHVDAGYHAISAGAFE